MDARKRMKELIPILTQAAKAYYQEDREIMSNLEYDKLYDELVKLEEETGITLAGSPTMLVGYEALEELPKEAHETPMLSLDKTKDREALRSFIGSHKTLLSWKLDGLTIVLTYREGKLEKAVTRGNGIIGEVITNNARVFQNIPLQIQHKGTLVLRGEAIITYSDFENRRTLMVISRTSSAAQFQNSLDHEKGHLCMHISHCMGIDPYGEEAQYLSGYVGQKMFSVARHFLCEHCREKLYAKEKNQKCSE